MIAQVPYPVGSIATSGGMRRASSLIVIPAYNEEANIRRVVEAVRANVEDADVLVVDDGSRDSTVCLATEAGAVVVSHPYNMGYGVACQTGFKYARRHGYEYVVQMDGDGQHEPRSVIDLLTAIRGNDADVVFGSRWLDGGDYRSSLLRKFGQVFFGWLAAMLTHQRVTDPTTGFQALAREVISFYSTDVYPVDYPDANVIVMLNRAGFRIKEVPVTMYPNRTGQSMHAGLIRPIYYGTKMMMSIAMTLLRDDKSLRRCGRTLRVNAPPASYRGAPDASLSLDLGSRRTLLRRESSVAQRGVRY